MKTNKLILGLVIGGLAWSNLASAQVQEAWVAPLSIAPPAAIKVDAVGNIYGTGGGGTMKLGPNGNQVWLAPTNPGIALAVDSVGNVHVIDSPFRTTKFDPNGNQLWTVSSLDPDSPWHYAIALALDPLGRVYVTGQSPRWDSSASRFVTVAYDAQGNQRWVSYFGGSAPGEYDNFSYPTALLVDGTGNVYVSGNTLRYAPDGRHCSASVTVKYDGEGNRLWVTRHPPDPGYGSVNMGLDTSSGVIVSRQTALSPGMNRD